jgi:hypothetical protein
MYLFHTHALQQFRVGHKIRVAQIFHTPYTKLQESICERLKVPLGQESSDFCSCSHLVVKAPNLRQSAQSSQVQWQPLRRLAWTNSCCTHCDVNSVAQATVTAPASKANAVDLIAAALHCRHVSE